MGRHFCVCRTTLTPSQDLASYMPEGLLSSSATDMWAFLQNGTFLSHCTPRS